MSIMKDEPLLQQEANKRRGRVVGLAGVELNCGRGLLLLVLCVLVVSFIGVVLVG